MAITNLKKAKINKKDEFYTQLADIERELGHYKNYFKDKIVFCNCDDPKESNFFKYFALNFKYLGIKKLVTTHFEKDKPSYKLEVIEDINNDGVINIEDAVKTKLKQNGDFRSPEAIKILQEVDIVVTNPPFSLFREYIAQLEEYNKKFIVIGSLNAITYKEIFKLIKENRLWIGYNNGDMEFKVPDYYEERATRFRQDENGQKWRSLGNICWFTNLDIAKRNDELILYKTYNEEEYPKYDNYNAINIDKLKDIPKDYKGIMGVPITFINKYSPFQFKLLGIMNTGEKNKGIRYEGTPHGRPIINGKEKYLRVLIQKRGTKNEN